MTKSPPHHRRHRPPSHSPSPTTAVRAAPSSPRPTTTPSPPQPPPRATTAPWTALPWRAVRPPPTHLPPNPLPNSPPSLLLPSHWLMQRFLTNRPASLSSSPARLPFRCRRLRQPALPLLLLHHLSPNPPPLLSRLPPRLLPPQTRPCSLGYMWATSCSRTPPRLPHRRISCPSWAWACPPLRQSPLLQPYQPMKPHYTNRPALLHRPSSPRLPSRR